MVQTPQQRRANAKYASVNEKRMGKPESTLKKKDAPKSPVNKIIVGVLIFVVIVPLLLEPLRLLPQAWEYIMQILSSIGLVKR
ncbi:uncharacterized protein HMPREF1541_06983 [Cyphellophora europaea CBS 101466]|uniref:Stress-associated endoplasmic reticulum protein n=1 Tax=Cyphellophora europaea (strain CBS 101466) TaxID=1220924 RepID=W2RR10_CYPE1|nr:uncharacterized protein HMPREF1541_06983 [Cyphellophora europaea CBS 101466]ETN38941.1 hypothetical protein HMPREF1541_06983 [Cyphellophora europaea CBS 101466]